ncbi:Rpa34 protein [Candida orthopsilosis Co 90-125]|uniref:Rpa34 protein n=1 Tax=Candida orthopsilosis (strain 90-125) TaxID=1136231 RepID=H8WXU7_CANO9|nr:Rpa34 protein [Candida orthopsilosis Co 90-125]CCG20894.1 Rpa34 protein [Candida orthopsilosis Co 90-125]
MAPTNYKSSEYVDDSDLEEDQEQVFEPPKHYHKLSHPSKSLPKAKDKEIWLIKTPKDFPLEKLKTLPIAFTKNRVAEPFDISGSSYQVEEELNPAASSSIIPTTEINNKHTIFKAKHNSYKPTDLKISRFYNIKEVVNIPQIDFDKARAPREDVPQLKRLRMRHYPTGYGEKDFEITYDGDSDVEEGKAIKKTKVEDEATHKEVHNDSKHNKEKKEKKDKKEKKEKKSKKDH